VKPQWSDIARRIGGKRAITLTAFLAGTPFWVFGLVFNEPSTFQSARNGWILLGIGLVGHGVMGLTLWLAHLSVARNRAQKPVAVWLMIVIWSSSSLTRLVVIVYGMRLFALQNDVPLVARIVTSILMASVGYGIAAYSFDAFDRFREERAQLLHKILSEEEQLSSHRVTIEGMKTTLIAQVDERVKDSSKASNEALGRLEQALRTRQDIQPAMLELRELSDQTWQRISQDLWAKAPSKPPRIRMVELLSLWARSQPFNMVFLTVVTFFLYLLVYSRVFEPVAGALISVTWLGGAVVFAVIANALLSRLDKTALPVLVGGVVFLVFSSIPIMQIFETVELDTASLERIVAVHGISITLAMFLSLPTAVIRTRQVVLDNLRSHITDKTLEKLRVESELAIVTQKIANHLHGDIRGNFLASMLTLQGHLDRNETRKAQGAIRKIRELLDQPITMADNDNQVANDLEAFLRNWSALVDISMNKPLSAFPEIFRPAIHTIVVDAVNNAVRHGSADWIRISVSSEPDAVSINISNNGNPNTANREGLGTANLNLLAPDTWKRLPTGKGLTQLLVRLDRLHLESALASR